MTVYIGCMLVAPRSFQGAGPVYTRIQTREERVLRTIESNGRHDELTRAERLDALPFTGEHRRLVVGSGVGVAACQGEQWIAMD